MRYILIVVSIFFSIGFVSQTYHFENYTNQDGLAQSQANYILQDNQGYLWIGTVGGLSKFDSHQFTNFYKKDGLLDNNITRIFEDDNNRLWIGTKGGLSLRNGNGFISFQFPEEIKTYKVLDILSYDSNTLMIATNGAGIVFFDIASNTFRFNPSKMVYIRKIFKYRNTHLIATPEGVFSVDLMKEDLLDWDKELFLPEFHNTSVNDIEMYNDSLWISTFKKGVYLLANNTLTHFTDKDGLVKNGVRDIALGIDGKIWFATNSGISCYLGDRFVSLTEKNGLKNTNIKHLFSDKNGSMWLASKGMGIFKFSGWLFTTLTKNDNLPSDVIMTITSDKDRICFGSYDNGVAFLDKNDSIKPVPEIAKEYMWSSLKTSYDNIWFGTTRGILVYKDGEVQNLNKEGRFDGTRVTALMEDEDGVIWIGHKDGFSSYDGHRFHNPTSELQLPIKRVRSFVKQGDKLWIGCKNGLFLYDGNIFSQFNESHGLLDNNVNSLVMDSNERLWIGTKNGLNILEKGVIKPVIFSSDQNDPVNLMQIVKDKLMIGSNHGLHVLQLGNNMDYNNPVVLHFNRSSGLPNMECNLNSISQVSDQEVYFGTSSGLVKMNLEVLENNNMSSPPDVHINGIRIFMLDKDLSAFADGLDGDNNLPINLRLVPKDNHITFDFTGISYTSPQDVKYKYRLIGADSDWLPITKSNFVTYSYLPHGEYTFEVKAANENSEWSNPKSYSFLIKKPYYLKLWFVILCSMVLLGLLYSIYLWRRSVSQKKNENELILIRSKLMGLEQQSLNSSMNRHFIFNALNSIQYYINREDKRSANTYLTNFAKLIRKNLDSTENDWSTLHDELERIELYLTMEHMRFQDRFNYSITVSDDIDVHHIDIPPMLFQPFLENSIWHGILPKETVGSLKLDIRKYDDQVKITISDDGIGIEQSKINKNGQLEHQSKGVDIINSRIKLFSKMTRKNFQIIGPKDIHDKNGVCIGTVVEIFMPIVQHD